MAASMILVSGCDYARFGKLCNVEEQSIPVYVSGIAGTTGVMTILASELGEDYRTMRLELYDPRAAANSADEKKIMLDLLASGPCKGNIVKAQIEASNNASSPFSVLGGEIISVIDSSSIETMFGHWNASLLSMGDLFQENDSSSELVGRNFNGFWTALEP